MHKLLICISFISISSYIFAGPEDFFRALDFGLKTLSTPKIHDNTGHLDKLESIRKGEVEGDVEITFSTFRVQNCTKISKVNVKTEYNGVGDLVKSFDCQVNYKLLTDEVLRLGGNVLFINSYSNKCDISTYQAIAYECKE